ncbi:hypothetical protein HYS82_01825, partial [Candidatus Amesbacteria bacterium]|nr:hypothetical protein [Candidatus Amesbacteria bacterium]
MSRVNTSGSEVAIEVANHKTTRFEQIPEKNLKWDLDSQNENFTNLYSNKILIICGPTATGKTKFGIEVAKKFNGEIVSADSRQVYTGKNLIHGKDLPHNSQPTTSNIAWRDRFLKYYLVSGTKIWLYDIVDPGEEFSVAHWKECADLIITDILTRKKLPIVVGGTGLYLKSLSQDLNQISIPPHPLLREKLRNKPVKYLFNYLNRIDSFKAASLNYSDRHNPHRLIRAIEIASFTRGPLAALQEDLLQNLQKRTSYSKKDSPFSPERTVLNRLQVGLTASRDTLYKLVDQRIKERINLGAASED